MDETDTGTIAYGDEIAGAETFAEQSRRRAETERDAVEWAIEELESQVSTQGVDLEPLLEYARRSRESPGSSPTILRGDGRRVRRRFRHLRGVRLRVLGTL